MQTQPEIKSSPGPENSPAPVPGIEITDLKKHFPVGKKSLFGGEVEMVKAVDGFDLSIEKGQIYGLAGESGCGKSTIGRLILSLIEPTSGSIRLDGKELVGMSRSERLAFRARIQVVFQDPYTSLNPRRTVGKIVSDPFAVHHGQSASQCRDEVVFLLEKVGLSPDHYYRYPHEFSGGQRQRIAIARALALRPEFLILDEPTSALDVSVQAVIINLIKDLQKEFTMTCLFITHDLNLLRFLCDRVAIMYLGQVVEEGETKALFENPLHPYSKALIASTPSVDQKAGFQGGHILEGEIPSALRIPNGCRFHGRCREKIGEICESTLPSLDRYEDRQVRCHLMTR